MVFKTKKQKSATEGLPKARMLAKIGVSPTAFRAGSDFASPRDRSLTRMSETSKNLKTPSPITPSPGHPSTVMSAALHTLGHVCGRDSGNDFPRTLGPQDTTSERGSFANRTCDTRVSAKVLPTSSRGNAPREGRDRGNGVSASHSGPL